VKVVHCVEGFPPEPTGGIQSLLCDLAPLLAARGVTSAVAAAARVRGTWTYEHAGMEVLRYPTGSTPGRVGPPGAADREGLRAFTGWLESQDADVFALHRWSRAAGLWHLEAARRAGLRTVVHVHLPEPLCARGTLMLDGTDQCDGRIDLHRCSACLGSPGWGARTGGRLGSAAPVALRLHRAARRLPRAVRGPVRSVTAAGWAPPQAEQRRTWLERMAELADVVVVPLPSIERGFLLNDFPAERLRLVDYGAPPPQPGYRWQRSTDGVLRVGFFGRMHPDKGLAVLVGALQRLPRDVPIELTVRTVPTNEGYATTVRALMANDDRIRIAPEFPRHEQDAAYGELDVLAIPSQWFELGPLVLFEARAHGLPVLASRLGGMAETVRDGVDGLLVPHDDERAWADALRRLATEPGLVEALAAAIPAVPSLDHEAAAWVSAYTSATVDRGADQTLAAP
jgi:glycosyltransferase involved in cell wall biosynthesis